MPAKISLMSLSSFSQRKATSSLELIYPMMLHA
jgi:hypothetical protein